jgi:hypothetical protein
MFQTLIRVKYAPYKHRNLYNEPTYTTTDTSNSTVYSTRLRVYKAKHSEHVYVDQSHSSTEISDGMT